MSPRWLLRLSLVLSLLTPGALASAAVIDAFGASQSMLVSLGSVNRSEGVETTDSLGNRRLVWITRDATHGGFVTVEIGGGHAQLGSAPASAATWTFHYDGDLVEAFDPAGLGGVDLTDAGTADRIRFLMYTETAIGIGAFVHTDATHASEAYTFSHPAGRFVQIDLPFSAFAPSAGSAPADFANAGAVILSFSFFDTLDSSLVARISGVSTLPEPRLALLVLGACAALLARRGPRSAD